jgi:cytochrome c biogenesis protein CcmG/thiol:disulfide interchange protein DsbE
VSGRRALLVLPAVLAGAGGVAFWAMLRGAQQGTFNPREVPNPLLGQPAPDFSVDALQGGPGIARADLTGPVILNFFASWCQPCLLEHPQLMALSRSGVTLWGIAYKDKVPAASGFLERHGNPFARVAQDPAGDAGIAWGITGVPESFLVDRQGVVRWRWPGPLLEDTVRNRLRPALQGLVS